MKIWIVDQNANLMYYAYSLSLGLVAHDCDVSIITRSQYEWSGPPHRRIKIVELFSGYSMSLINKYAFIKRSRLLRVIIKTVEYPIGYARFFKHYIRNKPDIIHFQYANVPFVEWLIFKTIRWIGTPFVFTVHNIIQPRPVPFERSMYRLVYRNIEYFIVHSQTNKQTFANLFCVDGSRITVIPHGNYNLYLAKDLPDRHVARQTLNLPVEGKIILFFGVIFDFKGLDVLIRALAMIPTETRPLLAIAGQPSQGFEKYAAEIERLGLAQYVSTRLRFIPGDEMASLFVATDVVVLPYRRITQSGVVFVAFSFGKPVVATRVGSLSETIVDGENGVLVAPDDEEALAAALTRILGDDDRLTRMGRRAKEISDERYDWRAIAGRTLEVYQRACGETT